MSNWTNWQRLWVENAFWKVRARQWPWKTKSSTLLRAWSYSTHCGLSANIHVASKLFKQCHRSIFPTVAPVWLSCCWEDFYAGSMELAHVDICWWISRIGLNGSCVKKWKNMLFTSNTMAPLLPCMCVKSKYTNWMGLWQTPIHKISEFTQGLEQPRKAVELTKSDLIFHSQGRLRGEAAAFSIMKKHFIKSNASQENILQRGATPSASWSESSLFCSLEATAVFL